MPHAMNSAWAIRLLRSDAATLAALRLRSTLEVLETEDEIWLRGKSADEELNLKLSALPAQARYEWLPDNRLRPLGKMIPAAVLPSAPWQPLKSWLQAVFPPAALAGMDPVPVELRLVRSAGEHETNLLQTDMSEWSRYALTAPKVRLERLRFAVDNVGRVLVQGNPVPPLPGKRFVVHGNIAVPAGFAWTPAVSTPVLLRVFGGAESSLILWEEQGRFTRFSAEQFVPASRAAVKATGQVFAETT
jgi:hypothetical protein